jgi:hypothetical protein
VRGQVLQRLCLSLRLLLHEAFELSHEARAQVRHTLTTLQHTPT